MFMIWQVGVKGSLERSGDLTSRTLWLSGGMGTMEELFLSGW